MGKKMRASEILATACKKAGTDASFCYVVVGGGKGYSNFKQIMSFKKYK